MLKASSNCCGLVLKFATLLWLLNCFSTCEAQPADGVVTIRQRFLQLKFFLHDDLETRPSPSAKFVVPPLQFSNAAESFHHFFGGIAVFDDAMTETEDVNSTLLGRGRGFYVFNAMKDDAAAIEFVWTAVFNEASGYGGSTLTFKGYDKITDPVREIAITGGTGQFRLARGWAIIKTNYIIEGAAKLYIVCNIYYGA